MTATPPIPVPDADPAASGLYPRLWRAGFRWLYVLDAVGILTVAVLVTVALGLYRADGTHVASINSSAAARAADDAGTVEVDYAVDSLAVQPGIYELSVALHDATMRRVFERHTHLVRFEVESTGVDQQNGLLALGGTWSARSADR